MHYENMSENKKECSLSREDIMKAKVKGYDALAQLIKSLRNSGDLLFVLENIGSLPSTFKPDCFIELLDYDNKDVRLWATKNLGKLKSISLLPIFMHIIDKDQNTSVKREAVSSIGRMRRMEAIPSLISILQNTDPKIVCQAIRGLLIFKGSHEVDDRLKELLNHENEMVVSIIKKE